MLLICPIILPADLKKTLAVLLDNIMLRLGKLETKVENIYNGTGGNLTNGTSMTTPSVTNTEKVNVAGLSLECWSSGVIFVVYAFQFSTLIFVQRKI